VLVGVHKHGAGCHPDLTPDERTGYDTDIADSIFDQRDRDLPEMVHGDSVIARGHECRGRR